MNRHGASKQYFPWGTGNPTFYLTMFAVLAAVAIIVVIADGAPAIAAVAGLAAFMVGGLAGVLFGIPRYAASAADRDATEAAAVRYRGNTNLEQISDWLTKIIVGVGLTQFRSIASEVSKISNSLSQEFSITDSSEAKATALSLLIVTTLSGFLFFYLWARVYLPTIFRESEATPTNPGAEDED